VSESLHNAWLASEDVREHEGEARI
jgi:hypothetical protein